MGDFRPVDPLHFIPSMIAIITFHFTNAPVLRIVGHVDPLSPELIAARRAAVLDFISAALFSAEGNSKGAQSLNARNRFLIILAVILIASMVYYLVLDAPFQ